MKCRKHGRKQLESGRLNIHGETRDQRDCLARFREKYFMRNLEESGKKKPFVETKQVGATDCASGRGFFRSSLSLSVSLSLSLCLSLSVSLSVSLSLSWSGKPITVQL